MVPQLLRDSTEIFFMKKPSDRLAVPSPERGARITVLVKIMLTLMDYFSPADRRAPWVSD
jgi:hypothetical protein